MAEWRGASLAVCPLCKTPKWAYLGNDLPWEPPCQACLAVLATHVSHLLPQRPGEASADGGAS